MDKIPHTIKISLILLIGTAMLTGCGSSPEKSLNNNQVHRLDLSKYSAEMPGAPLNLLFIHHSCGATLFADQGEKTGEYCLYESHPNGGGLRNLLRRNNYQVHEATYGSKIGQDTDINHWHAKFRDQMDLALKTQLQDDVLEGKMVNQIIVFKSCYPNNLIIADGTSPGDPDSQERTLWNCKAAYNSLLPIFKMYPNTLFVAMTAPPTLKPWMNKYKEMVLNFLGKGPESIGARARLFNSWLVDRENGWLAGYDKNNVVVFDNYDILTGKGTSNWTIYPSRDGKDSHPNSTGNTLAANEFVSFINRAVRYSGLVKNE